MPDIEVCEGRGREEGREEGREAKGERQEGREERGEQRGEVEERNMKLKFELIYVYRSSTEYSSFFSMNLAFNPSVSK